MTTKWHLRHEEHGNKPWKVQREALNRAEGRDRYGWFLEQGLGKTSLALNEFVDLYRKNLVDGMLVFCPNSFKIDWSMAPGEWGVPEIVGGYHPQLKTDRLVDQKGWLLATNYEAARAGAGDRIRSLLGSRRVYVVLDESLALGNPSTSTTKACIDICKRAAYVRLLNGTPTARDVMHYWGQLRAIGRLEGTNQYSFRGRFAKMGGYKAKQVVGIRNEKQLAKILDECSFRALKKDWRKDLPPQVFSHVRLEMTPRQRVHYREMVEDFLTMVGGCCTDENGMMVMAPMVLTQMDKLRQIASCLVIQDGKHAWLEDPNNNPKIRALMDIIESGGTKVIVSHYYRPTSGLLLQVLAGMGYDPAYIWGSEDPKLIADNKDRFNRDPKCRVMVGQQGATFRGHTLIGGKGDDRCNRMVFFENSFSYYQRVQMQDRIHRGAQDQECQYFDLITSPIEQVLVDVLHERKDFADAMDKIVLAAQHSKR